MSSSSVCASQDTFNNAFQGAVKYVEKKERPKWWVSLIAIAICLVLVVWALVLSMQVKSSPDNKLHIVFAIVFAPFYIIAYYLSSSMDMY